MGDRSDVYKSDEATRPPDLSDIPPANQKSSHEATPLHEQKARIALDRETGLRRTILIFTVFSAGITVALAVSIMVSDPQLTPHGAISSPNKMCSEMGSNQMKHGGNAVDAAITTLLCLGAVFPQYTGIGGGGFMLIHDHKMHSSHLIDFREISPSGLTPEHIKEHINEGQWRVSGLSVGVPGELRGLHHAWTMYGNRSWNSLFEPVIKMVKGGIPWYHINDVDLNRRDGMGDINENEWPWQKSFVDLFTVKGTVIFRPKLLKTLITLGKDGPDALYGGAIGKNIVKAVHNAGGVMTMNDLEMYNYTIREPIKVTLKNGYIVETFPAPAAGSLLVSELVQLDEVVEKAKTDKKKVDDDEYLDQVVKILSSTYPCRNLIGDPKFDESVQKHEKEFVTGDVSKCGDRPVNSKGTSHVSVVDQNEMLVSVTTSMNYWYGSMILTEDGILLNNQMNDFNTEEADSPNRPEGGKRPASSMVPTVVYHKDKPCLKRFAIGGVNASKIIGGVAQVIANIVLKDMSVKGSLDAPRLDCTLKSEPCVLFDPNHGYDGKTSIEVINLEAYSLVAIALKSNNTPVAMTDDYEEWGGDEF